MSIKLDDLKELYIREQILISGRITYIQYKMVPCGVKDERIVSSEEMSNSNHEISGYELCLYNEGLEYITVLNRGLGDFYSKISVKNFLELLCESLDLEEFSRHSTAEYGELSKKMLPNDIKKIRQAFEIPENDIIYFFRKCSIFGIKEGYVVTDKGVYLKHRSLLINSKSKDTKYIPFREFKNCAIGTDTCSVFIDDLKFDTLTRDKTHFCTVLFLYRLREYCKYKFNEN